MSANKIVIPQQDIPATKQDAPCRHLDELCGSITAAFISCAASPQQSWEGKLGWRESREEEVSISERWRHWAQNVRVKNVFILLNIGSL